MNIAELKTSIKIAWEAKKAVMVWGPPGIGKSQALAQLAAELGFIYIDIRLSQREAVDLMGIPFRCPDTGRTVWAVPSMWPSDPTKKYVISFDEINHGTQSTLSAAFQIIQENQLGEFKFPESTRYVAAGNRAVDRTYANKMPSGLRNRFTHVYPECSEDDWCAHASAMDFHELVIGFIRFSPTSLMELVAHNNTEEEKRRLNIARGNNAFSTPRAIESVSDYLKVAPLESLKELITGTIGEETAAKFFGYAEFYKDLPDLDKLLKNPSMFDVPDNPGMQYAICAGLAAKANATTFSPILKYIDRLLPEFQAMCVKDVLARDMTLSTLPAFATWSSKNDNILF